MREVLGQLLHFHICTLDWPVEEPSSNCNHNDHLQDMMSAGYQWVGELVACYFSKESATQSLSFIPGCPLQLLIAYSVCEWL